MSNRERARAIVHGVLALYLDVHPRSISDWHHIGDDLGLDPLDLLLVGARLSGFGSAERVFPLRALDARATVADLVTLFEAWAEDDEDEAAPPTLRCPPPETDDPPSSRSQPIPASRGFD